MLKILAQRREAAKYLKNKKKLCGFVALREKTKRSRSFHHGNAITILLNHLRLRQRKF